MNYTCEAVFIILRLRYILEFQVIILDLDIIFNVDILPGELRQKQDVQL